MKHTQAFLDYRSSLLPEGRKNVSWNLETFSKAVDLLAPGFIVEAGQEWINNKKPLWLVCSIHGRYEVTPNSFLKQSKGSGCAQCQAQKKSDSAGKVRQPRASESKKNEARKLYAELGNYREVARIVGRSAWTIQRWCDLERAEKGRLYNAKWRETNREQSRANTTRYQTDFLHGRVNRAKAKAMRRGDYREYDDAGNIIYQEWETYTPEDELQLKQIEARLKELNDSNYMGIKWSLEHLLPLSKGGEHSPYNLSITPLEDNISKNDKLDPGHLALREHKIARMFSNVA